VNKDQFHLKLLKFFHYIVAGLSCAFASLFSIHAYIGWLTMHGRGPFHDAFTNFPSSNFGVMFFILGIVAVCLGWLFGGAIAYAGYSIGRRKHHMFCLVVAGLLCAMCNPFSTALGVFAFIVLLRPSVKELFQPPAPQVD
jgi:hypothetical protein